MDEEKTKVIIEGEQRARIKDPFKNFLLTIIAIALIAIAIPTLYNFKLTWQANEDAKAKAKEEFNIENNNISQARNTLFEDGIVGVLLDSFQKNTKWDFFIANNGKYIVEAEGDIEDPSKFITIIKKTNRLSYENYIYELEELDPTSIQQMTFRIQFRKQLGKVFETEYNHYECSYSEINVTLKNGTTKTINTYAEAILDYFEAFIQDTLK